MKKSNNPQIRSLSYIGAVIFLFLFMNTPPINCYAMWETEAANNISTLLASPRETSLGWRYQKINNVLYKRLYNYDTKQWIGDWIKVS